MYLSVRVCLLEELGGEGISGATVRAWPGPIETTSQSDGYYQLNIDAGDVTEILVKQEGFVPFSYYGLPSTLAEDRVVIQQDETTEYNVELSEIANVGVGTASFSVFGSFLSALGLEVQNELGDFSVRQPGWIDWYGGEDCPLKVFVQRP